jgi:steroid delta-isomerase
METSDMVATVERYVEAFEKQDLQMIREMYSADAHLEDPVGSEARNGIEAVCEFYEGAFNMGAKLELTGSPRCAGNSVAFPFRVKMPGMAIEVIDVFEFNHEGKVHNMRAYWGPDNMLK